MQDDNGDRSTFSDPLADIIRAAGKRPAPPQQHYEQVYAATHAIWQRQLRRQRQRRWYPIAAAVALMALGATLWQTMLSAPPPVAARVAVSQGLIERFLPEENRWTAISADALNEGLRLRTGGDGSIALRLADGGSLRLHNDTEVVLAAASFELINGTVYFDSTGRVPGNSVEIVTPLGRVRDIGTQFEVRATRASLRVRTRSGEIAVLDSPVALPLASQSGEELELFAAGQVSRRSFAPDDPQWGWAEALAVAPEFATPTVLAYLEWIATETGRQLQFESESVRLQANVARFLGNPAGLMPTELLITITATSDFSYELTSDGSILIGRDDQVR